MENIEKYFSMGNGHWNQFAFFIYEEARKLKVFEDLETPLRYFKKYETLFWCNRERPLTIVQQLLSEMREDELVNEQQRFILETLKGYFKVTVFTTDQDEEMSLDFVAKALDVELLEFRSNKKEEGQVFDFEQVLVEIGELPNPKDKIAHLVKLKTAYKQTDTLDWGVGPNFGKKCDFEIQKWKEILALEQNEKTAGAMLRLSSRRGAKTDLIRIFSALYALDFFRNEEGFKVEKIEVMKRMGAFLGEDWSKYDKDLSQAFLQSEKANTHVFEQLIQEIQKQYNESEARRI